MSAFQIALKRLVNTDWKQEYNHAYQGSYIALAREFCRRSALWADKLGCTSKWPFFNIPEMIEAGFADPRIEPALARIEFRQSIVRQIGAWYLLWHAITDARPEAVEAFALPAPYEPLIVLFERGCNSLVREHHLLYVGVAGIPVTNWRAYLVSDAFASLDSEGLNSVDQTYQHEFAQRASNK